MSAIQYIAIWGLAAIFSAVVAAILAAFKRRNPSAWAAWCFLIPPAVLLLALLPKNTGPLPPSPPMDDDDRDRDLF